MKIPVFHDDQHGTAIISGAAILNALEIAEKRIEEIRVVVSGAGASGIACARYYVSLGVRPENLLMCDSKGVIYKGREVGMNRYKEEFARDRDAQGRHHGDRSERLPESGEQRARIPVHLPRRARLLRNDDQRGDEARRAAMVREENLAIPILLGRPKRIEKTFERLDLNRGNTEIVDVEHDRRLEDYADEYYRLRHRKGITRDGARTATR